jgi:hypothetical protein
VLTRAQHAKRAAPAPDLRCRFVVSIDAYVDPSTLILLITTSSCAEGVHSSGAGADWGLGLGSTEPSWV